MDNSNQMKKEFFILGITIILVTSCTQLNNTKKLKRIVEEGLNLGNRAPDLEEK
jgi:hypothetical protein